MNANQTSRGRRFLPLLVLCCGFAGFPASAQADMLSSHLTDQATPSQAEAFAGHLPVHVVYREQHESEAHRKDVHDIGQGTLGACRCWPSSWCCRREFSRW